MQRYDHAIDAVKVAGAGSLAVLTSFHEESEWWLRMSVLTLSLLYTVLKIWQHFTPKKGGNDE